MTIKRKHLFAFYHIVFHNLLKHLKLQLFSLIEFYFLAIYQNFLETISALLQINTKIVHGTFCSSLVHYLYSCMTMKTRQNGICKHSWLIMEVLVVTLLFQKNLLKFRNNVCYSTLKSYNRNWPSIMRFPQNFITKSCNSIYA